MELKNLVQNTFNRAIESAPVPTELKVAASKHPNTKKFLDNLYSQLVKVEALRRTQGKKSLKKNVVEETVTEFTHQFLKGIDNEATRRAESDIARVSREHEIQKAKDLETSERTGNFVGEWAELQEGIKFDRTKVDSI